MMSSTASPNGEEVLALSHPSHLDWLAEHREALLDFYQPNVLLPGGSFAYLDYSGEPLPQMGAQLWLGARMLHCFSIAAMLGRPGAREIAERGLGFYLEGPGRDHEHGGWFATVGGENPSDAKELYGQAHMLLGASSAAAAELDGASDLLQMALDVIERFWVEADGRCIESFDRTFSAADTYRGQNANMHLTEAYLAAFEVTANPKWLERAVTIASHIAGRAANDNEGSWRLPEHFDHEWRTLPDHNRDDPRHAFRPYGSQPGHWLEWSKLLMQIRGLGRDDSWLLPAAVNLFKGAFKDGWAPNGGFCYTVDWDGTPVVREKYFWEVAEGVGAAASLYKATGDPSYADAYETIWQFTAQNFIDSKAGSWFPELDPDSNRPVVQTWPGKPDLYHALQATIYAALPPTQGIATWARLTMSGAS